VLIANPRASRVTEELIAAVEGILRPAPTLLTERSGHAVELAREAGSTTIYVLGGDGTFNEVLNGLDDGAVVGFLPGGGTSVLPRALGLPRDPVEAAQRIGAGRRRRITVGRVNGRRFGFAAGVGLDAELLRLAGRARSGRRPGDLAVAWAAVRVLARHRLRFEPVVEIAGPGAAAFALVANADPYTYLGPFGVHLAREARFELGLDLVAPRRLGPRDYPAVVRYLLTGGGGLDLVRGHDLDLIELACSEPMPLQADGEDLGDVTEAVFEAERDAVTVLVG
jgi:diacylglycerol kinase family enzyme